LSVAFIARRHGNTVVPRFAQRGKRSLSKWVRISAARWEAFQTKQPKGKAFLTEKMQEWVITQRQQGTREIRVILYAKADSFCATAMADELSVEDLLAIEHDVIPLDGADVFQQGEIDPIGDRVRGLE